MVAAHRPKPLDKQDICRKVTAHLRKAYAQSVPKRELPVLETLLYAICLENAPMAQADSVYARLLNAFHDLNEVRVSSITELLPMFVDIDEPDWRALRIKSSLQYIFESNYAFDFESLKRKTSDLAAKQLAKIPSLSSFVRSYVLQHCLDSHVLPIDSRMHAALVWLGLADAGSTPEQAADGLRSYVRKSDAELFCHVLHCLATDPKRQRAFANVLANPPEKTADPIGRLDLLLRRGVVGAGRSRSRKSPPPKSPAKSASHKSAASKQKIAGPKSSRQKVSGSKSAGKNGRHPARSPQAKLGSKKRH
ncbi:MAG: hypothetical protein EXS05_10730 [Planctomycetaceae bacterium]|nr:hypothetical protein [Planctomycetaceae bacterium]